MGRGNGGQASREFKERMTEQILSRAMGGNDGGQEPDRPDYCGECRFFEPAGSIPVSDGDGVSWRQSPVCQLEPPKVMVVQANVMAVQTNVFNGVEPITRAERLACRHGIRRS